MGQIVAEFGIVAFNTIGLTFVGERNMDTKIVEQRQVSRTGITLIQHGLRSGIQKRLLGVSSPLSVTVQPTIHWWFV
jgi:hypothetical protein